jgi:hypothetical protein
MNDTDDSDAAPVDPAVAQSQAAVRELVYGCVAFAWFAGLLLVFWVGIPVLNTQFINGYPRMGIPPMPGPFLSTLYSFSWWVVWLIGLTALLPAFLLIALMDMSKGLRADLHWMLSVVCAALNLFCFVALIFGIGCFYCNNTFSGGSICNSPLYCCVFYASNPQLCPNTANCDPNYTLFDIGQDYFFYLNWVMALVLFFVSMIMITLNTSLRRYGAFSSVLELATVQPFPDDAQQVYADAVKRLQ